MEGSCRSPAEGQSASGSVRPTLARSTQAKLHWLDQPCRGVAETSAPVCCVSASRASCEKVLCVINKSCAFEDLNIHLLQTARAASCTACPQPQNIPRMYSHRCMTTYTAAARERLEEEVQATLRLVACNLFPLLCPPRFASLLCSLVSKLLDLQILCLPVFRCLASAASVRIMRSCLRTHASPRHNLTHAHWPPWPRPD